MPKFKFAATNTLLIVESPAKCGKIQSYLGPGYKVIASFGHLRELTSLKNINMETFDIHYDVVKDTRKRKHIEQMRTDINKSDEVIIATDDDREGEAIGWHICMLFDLPVATTKRILFREITETAILDAMKSPRTLDMHLVNAQRARQTLDLLVGFTITPYLWKHVTQHAEKSLSAGRCQTPALRLIYENQKAIEQSPGTKVYNTTGYFTNHNIPFDLNKRYETQDEMQEFLEDTVNHDHLYSVSKPKKVFKKQPEPLTTSRIQQLASNELRISPKETMKICQVLYEGGFITYMRTDSKKFSQEFITNVKGHIIKAYLDEKYIRHDIDELCSGNKPIVDESKKKSKSKKTKTQEVTLTQDAHEAIRPTNITLEKMDDKMSSREKSLYKLIRETTLESCMEVAEYYSITANISAPKNTIYSYISETVHFPGWKIVKNKLNDTSEKFYIYLQAIPNKKLIDYKKITCKTTVTNTKQHYTEARLVQLLEDNGIGRPSTFSSLVEKIQQRDYVKKTDVPGKMVSCIDFDLEDDTITEQTHAKEIGNEKGKLVIQSLGVVVLEFLDKHFSNLFEYGYTREMEAKLDNISSGEYEWTELCKSSVNDMRELGNEVTTEIGMDKFEYQIDDKYTYMIGKYGPVIRYKNELLKKKGAKNTKNIYSFLPVIDDIDLDKLKRGEYKIDDVVKKSTTTSSQSVRLGMYKGEVLFVKKGKFGLYTSWGKNTLSLSSIGEDVDIADITSEMVIEILDKKTINGEGKGALQNENIIRSVTDNISIRRGKYGHYIFHKTKEMTKPKFYKLNGYTNDYQTGSLELLKIWLYETYKVA